MPTRMQAIMPQRAVGPERSGEVVDRRPGSATRGLDRAHEPEAERSGSEHHRVASTPEAVPWSMELTGTELEGATVQQVALLAARGAKVHDASGHHLGGNAAPPVGERSAVEVGDEGRYVGLVAAVVRGPLRPLGQQLLDVDAEAFEEARRR